MFSVTFCDFWDFQRQNTPFKNKSKDPEADPEPLLYWIIYAGYLFFTRREQNMSWNNTLFSAWKVLLQSHHRKWSYNFKKTVARRHSNFSQRLPRLSSSFSPRRGFLDHMTGLQCPTSSVADEGGRLSRGTSLSCTQPHRGARKRFISLTKTF